MHVITDPAAVLSTALFDERMEYARLTMERIFWTHLPALTGATWLL